MKSSFNKPAAYEKYYQILIKNEYFETLKDVFMLSAVLGFEIKCRLPFEKSGGDPIKEHIFQQDDFDVLDIIAIQSTGGIEILLNENKDKRFMLLEEYAHGGIKYLVDNIFLGEGTSEEAIVNFSLMFRPEKIDEVKTDFGGLISEVVRKLETE